MRLLTVSPVVFLVSLCISVVSANPQEARGPTIPGPPPDPAKPNGDGSGAWKSKPPNYRDWVTVAQFYSIASVAGSLGLNNAERNMIHYLSAAGSDLNVPPEDMMAALAPFREAVKTLVQNQATAGYKSITAATGSKTFLSGWKTFYATKDLSWDWYFAIGGFSYSVGGIVTKTKKGGTLQYRVYIFDRYNWDTGKSVDIGPIHFEDKDLGRLHLVGLAREFTVRGSGEVNEISSFKPGTEIPSPNTGGRD